MPHLRIPRKNGLHRQACISLYRSLLRESRRAGTVAADTITRASNGTSMSDTNLTETLRSLIRYRFHKDKAILSPPQASNALASGLHFLTLLRSCSENSPTAIAQLLRTLAQVTQQAEATAAYRTEVASRWKPPPESRIPHLRNLREIASKKNQVGTPKAPRIFQHPRPLVEVKSGVRKVPNLILCQGIPLLKYPGPVPVIVNRVLKEKVNWRVRKWDQHFLIKQLVEIGEAEDEWDTVLAEQMNFKDEGGNRRKGQSSMRSVPPQLNKRFVVDPRNPSWASRLQEIDKEIETAAMERGRAYAKMGERFYHQVVVKERDLKEHERKAAKRARRIARKAERAEENEKGEAAKENVEVVSSISSGYI